eukprot:5649934-Prymnesium_polylepis.1
MPNEHTSDPHKPRVLPHPACAAADVRHLMRKSLSAQITPRLIDRLRGDRGLVLLIADYKAKVLPGRNRETQTEAFGKKGKSLWGTTAIRWDPKSGDCEVLNVRI